ncbi:MAG TPA: lytic transglycosylase domain-containing protein [Thermoanaerobaculia bacterium]|nr:lytic transglycosylase domain-containing protein [Thermoanaerobaculia bacterium]
MNAAAATLLLALQAAPPVADDPRAALVALQLAGRPREALARAERELAVRPEAARAAGLDYLRGHLLDLLGRPAEAMDAFGAALTHTPRLTLHSRYRMALDQERMGHPEVAAGVIAGGIRAQPESPLLPDALRLLERTLAQGGDCRVLRGLFPSRLRPADGRRVALLQADCARRAGQREAARGVYLALLERDVRDETARDAAERLAALLPAGTGGRAALRLGQTFHHHREWEEALSWLRAALAGGGISAAERLEAQYAVGRALFFRDDFAAAAAAFAESAARVAAPAARASALYQQARAHELLGERGRAIAAFRAAHAASPDGEWAAAALVAALRLHWLAGQERPALGLYALLQSRREWREQAARAALFLAASDLVRGRHDRARGWLAQAALGTPEDAVELAYWRGRRLEAAGDKIGAVRAYAAAAREEPASPFARAALARAAAPALAPTTAVEARRLAASRAPGDLHAAWLLAPGSRTGQTARALLLRRLAGDPGTAPFVLLAQVPVERWPLWTETPATPEEVLLGLGLWREGAPAVGARFPPSDPSLALTGSMLLARAGEAARSIRLAEAIRLRTPDRVPLALQPSVFRAVLYPLPHRETLLAEARRRGVDPHLLAALVREESRFDARAFSGAAARGLAQLVTPTARRVAAQAELQLAPGDLYRPEVSLALGAAYLAELLREVGGAEHLAVAAYNAGPAQARLWRGYCASDEPAEYLTKVGFRETRAYLRRVLTSREHYERLYGGAR